MPTLTTSELLDELEAGFGSLEAANRRLESALQTAQQQIKALKKRPPAKPGKAASKRKPGKRVAASNEEAPHTPPKERRVLGMGLAQLRKNDRRPSGEQPG